jgi:hypothetical protein
MLTPHTKLQPPIWRKPICRQIKVQSICSSFRTAADEHWLLVVDPCGFKNKKESINRQILICLNNNRHQRRRRFGSCFCSNFGYIQVWRYFRRTYFCKRVKRHFPPPSCIWSIIWIKDWFSIKETTVQCWWRGMEKGKHLYSWWNKARFLFRSSRRSMKICTNMSWPISMDSFTTIKKDKFWKYASHVA